MISQRSLNPQEELPDEVGRHDDSEDGLALLLLLVLQLDRHQAVVELGDLTPDQLQLLPGCQVVPRGHRAESRSRAVAPGQEGAPVL